MEPSTRAKLDPKIMTRKARLIFYAIK